ncbi:MAG: SUF system NifU family Fe-S cluster assembly protein [Legionellaceae bacterium]|nr:SUF system NifU family Fe-S cluster assembly protein [Legionellaceae bacterium]MBP9775238.1 SUF system NifU family Fe-S cluster assembly protein [Legionellaceae bacterium]
MSDLRELYQEVIIDHSKHPRHHYAMEQPTHRAQGYNPLCGDKLTVFVQIEQDRIHEISFLGCGCAISQASASLMTDAVQGLSTSAADALFQQFHHMLTAEDSEQPASMDKLTILAGVRAFPARVKCATLAWHTLEAALHREAKTVVTE